MTVTPTLFFTGNAEEALEFYAGALDGKIEIQRFAESPAAGVSAPGYANKVLYGAVTSAFGSIAAMDAPPGREGEPGSNFAISIELEDDARAAAIFTKLAAGGAITMPWEQTFFAKKFGMATDKFGIRWMVRVLDPALV